MEEVLAKLKVFREERNWDGSKVTDLIKSVVLESAELLELVQWKNPDNKEFLTNSDLKVRLDEELADVLIYALDICLELGIDPKEIIYSKLAKNAIKYPAKDLKHYDA
jgi:dCTP diphosphatase